MYQCLQDWDQGSRQVNLFCLCTRPVASLQEPIRFDTARHGLQFTEPLAVHLVSQGVLLIDEKAQTAGEVKERM